MSKAIFDWNPTPAQRKIMKMIFSKQAIISIPRMFGKKSFFKKTRQ